MHCVCNTVQLLQRYRLPFYWTMPPTVPQLNALITRLRESHSSVSMSRESKRLKKSSSWLNSGNVLIQHWGKMQFSRFSVLPGSAEAQINWCDIVKCLLIAYFIGNISAKKISKSVHMCQAKGGTFLRHGVVLRRLHARELIRRTRLYNSCVRDKLGEMTPLSIVTPGRGLLEPYPAVSHTRNLHVLNSIRQLVSEVR